MKRNCTIVDSKGRRILDFMGLTVLRRICACVSRSVRVRASACVCACVCACVHACVTVYGNYLYCNKTIYHEISYQIIRNFQETENQLRLGCANNMCRQRLFVSPDSLKGCF